MLDASKTAPARPLMVQAILYTNPDGLPPFINGARLLSANGFRMSVLCRERGSGWGVAYPPQVKIRRLRPTVSGNWREYVQFIARTLRLADSSADVVMGHDMHGLLPAWLVSRRFRRPLVYQCHDFTERDRNVGMGGSLVRTFEGRFARTADLVIVPDAERGEIIARALRLHRPPMVVANAPIGRPVASSAALRNALAETGKSFERIVFRQGRVGAGHAIEATLRSIPAWRSKKWGFVVMGRSDAAYVEATMRLASELDVSTQFTILPPVGYDDVAHFTMGADVGHALYEPVHVNHATCTTSSNKMLEYMAAELPLLVSDTPSLRQLVTKYRCGATADHRSPESIAHAINLLIENPADMRRMGHAAARAFDEEFSFERQFAPMLSALHALTAQPGRGSALL